MKHAIRKKRLAGAVILAQLFAAQAIAQPPAKPVEVEVSQVIQKPVAPRVWVPGTIISRENARIASELDGTLVMLVEEGQRVTQNQPIAAIKDKTWQLRLERDKAKLEQLKVQLQFAELQLKRNISLSRSNDASQSRIDELEQARDVLKHEVAIAQIEMEESAYQRERTRLYAPFPGVVVERYKQPGEYVSAGEGLIRLVNTDALEVTARAPMTVSAYSHPGDKVVVKARGQEIETTLKSIIPVGDANTRMLEVRLHLSPGWVVGDAVSVSLKSGEESLSTVVARDALILRPNSVFLYVVDDQNLARRVPVTLGDGDMKNIVVKGQLSPNDKVVVRGGERLEDGNTVVILDGKENPS